MRTLVLCVDRDNDLGEKTGLRSPVIGRKPCLNAATELGIKDPEDTDTNAIFMGVNLLDTLLQEGKDVEMAIVTGHKYLGQKADRTLADQLDQVLDEVKPNRAILVSDGVSDEAVMPILQSRVKIDHTHRFLLKPRVVKWEEKTYALLRYMDHDSVRIGIGVPLTLLMIFYGSFKWTGLFGTPLDPALGIILVIIGVIFLTRALHLQERTRSYIRALRKDIRSASLNPIIALAAMIILFIGSYYSYLQVVSSEVSWKMTWEAFLLFGLSIIWWIVLAVLLRLAGAFLNTYIRFKKVRLSFLHDAMQVLAWGSILYGALIATHFILVISVGPTSEPFPILSVSVFIIIGIITAVVSAAVYRFIRIRIRIKKKKKVESL